MDKEEIALPDEFNEPLRRVVSFTLTNNKSRISIEEQCDNYFGCEMDKAKFIRLLDYLRTVADTMQEQPAAVNIQ